MRNSFMVFSIAALFTANVHAQDSRWSLTAGVGLAFPLGEFGSKNIRDSTAAFAKAGPACNLGFDYKLKKNVELSFLFSGQQNNVDTKILDYRLDAAFPGYAFHSTSNNWLSWKLMAGAYFLFPLDQKNKINVTARLMAGMLKTSTYKFSQMQTTLPKDSLNLGGGGGLLAESYEFYRHPVSAAFTYLAGVGIQYRLDKRISFKTSIDYSAATLRFARIGNARFSGFTLVTGTTTGPGTVNQMVQVYPKQPFASMNWCGGVEINL
ncbi:MAG TPA: hypothetical protein VKR53_00345 [Puia sp.]|nr:hypothetical protein [Puia sp.]